ncbi:MAG TPA: carboxylesterase family protein [Micromonosporaceae bacterium]
MDEAPEIRTAAGVVRGRREGAVAVFRGIHYARPPFGPHRFGAPVPPEPWDGVRDALEFGLPAPQSARSGPAGEWVVVGSGDGTGDCLTLNVWSPDIGAAGLPVMAWIHGGAYRTGSSDNPHYDCATLAAAGAVVVSMNYRVGAEGFAHIAGAPDNRGILDQAAALQWVKDNAAAFGGDVDNVTVFGQSAGAGCIAALLGMPTAAGLFRRAIAQSVPGTYFSTRLAGVVSTAIAAELGTQATIADLAGVSPHALVTAADAVTQKMPAYAESWGPMALTPTPFSPVVDGDVLPEAPWQALAGGAARHVDLLVGHTRDEYRLLATRSGETVTAAQLTATLDRLAPAPDGGAAYLAAYPDASPGHIDEVVNADWLFRMPSLHLAEAQHAGRGNAWTYELRWSSNPDDGASHSLDVLLVLGTLGADRGIDVAGHMRADWLTFATTGKPGWAAYDPATRTTRVYDTETTVQIYPEETSYRIWRTHDFATLDLLTTA